MKQSLISRCEQEFIIQAVRNGTRIDGRHTYDYRKIAVEFGNEVGLCQVTQGQTRVLVQVSSEVVIPKPSRPSEGVLYLNVELSRMAASNFEGGRPSEYCVEINRLLERCVVESRALDFESLCIVAGEKVWAIRIDAHVLNHDGNIMDCLSIATIAALVHFRRPEVTISGEDVTIHTLEEKNPVPLSIHHWPICVTFAFFDKGNLLIVDPTEREERVMDGKTVLAMNIYREICTLHMGGTISLHKDQILRCAEIAASRVVEIVELIKTSLAVNAQKTQNNNNSGFLKSIQKNLITTSSQDLMEMSILRSRKKAREIVREGTNRAAELGDKIGASVRVRGPGTAQIGEGGETTWSISDDDESEEEEDVLCVPENLQKPIENLQKPIETVELSGDSEEEDIVTLHGTEINVGNGEPPSSSKRAWYIDQWNCD